MSDPRPPIYPSEWLSESPFADKRTPYEKLQEENARLRTKMEDCIRYLASDKFDGELTTSHIEMMAELRAALGKTGGEHDR
jgi:hypothetical protein